VGVATERGMAADLAVDLGCDRIRVYVPGRGIVVDQPCVVARRSSNRAIVAACDDALRYISGRQADSVLVSAREGTAIDFEAVSCVLRHATSSAGWGTHSLRSRTSRQHMLLCVEHTAGDVECRALIDAAKAAGARSVSLLSSAIAAAVGAGVNLHRPHGAMVMDVGSCLTSVVVVSLGSVLACETSPVGGRAIDRAIREYLRDSCGVYISDKMAEEVKKCCAFAAPVVGCSPVEITGRDVLTGMDRSVQVRPEDLRLVVEPVVDRIVGVAINCVTDLPPELSRDLVETGIGLVGGGALLAGLSLRVEAATGLPVTVLDRPVDRVCLGAGRLLKAREIVSYPLRGERRSRSALKVSPLPFFDATSRFSSLFSEERSMLPLSQEDMIC